MKTLTYAFRFLIRSKSYTLINLLGLAFSLACCIILMRYIHRELTVDTHCVDRDRVIACIRNNNENYHLSSQTYCDTTYIADDQIFERCRIIIEREGHVKYNEHNYTLRTVAADSTFFYFFDYPLHEGVRQLNAPNDALLTRECAQRIFGNESAIGKVINFNGNDVVVKGVIDQPACPTLLCPELILSFQHSKQWRMMMAEILHVVPTLDLDEINALSTQIKDGTNPMSWEFKSWKDLYFGQKYMKYSRYHDILQSGNRTYLYILSLVVILLLFVGTLNFVNLYMVFMMKRSKEYGIKKVFGLQKMPLFFQIWAENFLLAIAALLVAWLLVEITQVPVSRLMHATIGYTAFDWQLSLGFLLVLPIVTSIYPYVRYNFMPPVVSIRSIAGNRQSVVVRMGFLFVQYIITTLLIVASLYFNKHLQYLLNTPPGYQSENILMAELIHENYSLEFKAADFEAAKIRGQRIQQLLDECPYIENWAKERATLLGDGSISEFINDKDQKESVRTMFVSANFFRIHGLEVVEGELIESKDFYADSKLFLNHAALKAFGYTDYKEAFLRAESPLWVMVINGKIIEGGTKPMPVTAVVKDYYSGHLTEGIKPIAYLVSANNSLDRVYLKVKSGHEKDIIDYLKKIEQEVYHTDDFKYSWLADDVKALYKEDRQIATIYSVFALIAIAVSCLGLFGISLFDIRQRYREIAIRKVNGAGLKDLYRLLFKKYLLVLVASFVVATPLAYYLIHRYTADFAVKAPIGIGIFAWALLLIVTISVGTLWWQIRKASNIDPAVVMKTE